MKEEFLNIYAIIGANVKFFRKEKQWSQDDLANRCSVNRAKISRIENVRKDYMISTLLEVSKALGKDIEDLFKKHVGVQY